MSLKLPVYDLAHTNTIPRARVCYCYSIRHTVTLGFTLNRVLHFHTNNSKISKVLTGVPRASIQLGLWTIHLLSAVSALHSMGIRV